MKIKPGATLNAIMARAENYRRSPSPQREGSIWHVIMVVVVVVLVNGLTVGINGWQIFHPAEKNQGLFRCENDGSLTMKNIDFWGLDTKNEDEISRRLRLALCARTS